jgi:hypothetical protein
MCKHFGSKDDHLMGKQHVGYARLRAGVDAILEERRRRREERDKEKVSNSSLGNDVFFPYIALRGPAILWITG